MLQESQILVVEKYFFSLFSWLFPQRWKVKVINGQGKRVVWSNKIEVFRKLWSTES